MRSHDNWLQVYFLLSLWWQGVGSATVSHMKEKCRFSTSEQKRPDVAWTIGMAWRIWACSVTLCHQACYQDLLLQDQDQNQDSELHGADEDQDFQFQDQNKDQDFENWVSIHLETKTQIARTTTLLQSHQKWLRSTLYFNRISFIIPYCQLQSTVMFFYHGRIGVQMLYKPLA